MQHWQYSSWDNVCTVLLFRKRLLTPFNDGNFEIVYSMSEDPRCHLAFTMLKTKPKAPLHIPPLLYCVWDGMAILLGNDDWITAAFDFQVFLVPSWWLNMCGTLWYNGENGTCFLWNEKKVVIFSLWGQLPENQINSILFLRLGRFWLCNTNCWEA